MRDKKYEFKEYSLTFSRKFCGLTATMNELQASRSLSDMLSDWERAKLYYDKKNGALCLLKTDKEDLDSLIVRDTKLGKRITARIKEFMPLGRYVLNPDGVKKDKFILTFSGVVNNNI